MGAWTLLIDSEPSHPPKTTRSANAATLLIDLTANDHEDDTKNVQLEKRQKLEGVKGLLVVSVNKASVCRGKLSANCACDAKGGQGS